MGGDLALTVRSTVGAAHNARRRLLERVAGIGERVELGWRDAQSLYLPERIDLYPDAALNRELYFWLMALAARDDAHHGGDWFARNRAATAACLRQMPGLAAVYARLAAALLPLRDLPRRADERAGTGHPRRPATAASGHRPAALRPAAAAGAVVAPLAARRRPGPFLPGRDGDAAAEDEASQRRDSKGALPLSRPRWRN